MLMAAGAAAQDKPPSTAPPAEDVSLETKDGVQLTATYYPGTKGKNTVPVIMLHADKGSRHDFDEFAQYLQREFGHAVMVPDLRGHGDSTTVKGTDKNLEAEMMPSFHYARMAQPGGDLEKVKSFLLEKHNAGQLNIDKLCVIGAEMGGLVAITWSVLDWKWPVLATGRQGQDVKAVVLISPLEKHKGLKMSGALVDPVVKTKISFYIALGASDSKALKEARQLYKALDRYRPPPEDEEDKTVFIDETMETRLQGTELLVEPALGLKERIAEFIRVRLVEQTIPWKERKRPLD